jgi:hypothetical protein
MQSQEKIWIITADAPQIKVPDATREVITRELTRVDETQRSNKKVVEDAAAVSVETLEQNMTSFLSVVGRLFSRAEEQSKVDDSGMQLDEIELSVEITAEGEIKLLGTGVKGGGKGGLTLKFKRTQ